MELDRRRFLVGAGAVVLGSLNSCRRTTLPTATDQGLIVYPGPPGSRCFETRPEVLGRGWITPNSHFFVLSRRNVSLSAADTARWQIRIDGEVDQPFAISVQDLLHSKDLQLVKFPCYVQCVGNGRRNFVPRVGNPPFAMGAIGNAFWMGISLPDLLKRAGVKSEAGWVSLLEQGAALHDPQSYIKSIPIKKAMDERTIVALSMNDEPLPAEHGGPARAIVPGWGGTYSVKWLSDIIVAKAPWNGFQMGTAYRMPKHPIPPGTMVPPAEMDPFTVFSVGSMFTSPSEGARLEQGGVTLEGFAWAGESEVTAVEVSVDNGRKWDQTLIEKETAPLLTSIDQGQTWSPSRSGGDDRRYVWQRWRYQWDAAPGNYRLRVRARDSDGQVQPVEQDNWNPGGYGWHGADTRNVTVG
jgi:DMSO/TMAO reductase YedYZ molybdopterin-dependent catalytic subunit